MELDEILRKRRMVRAYTDQPVSPDALRRIVRMVHRVPSAGRSQGQRLIVVQDAALRERAGSIADGRYVRVGLEPWISRAPVHVYICAHERSYRERYPAPGVDPGAGPPWPVPFWWYDCGSLFMLLQLAAINEQLAVGFHSSIDAAELDPLASLIGMPAEYALAGLLTIGHPRDAAPPRLASHEVPRKPLEELVDWR